jgi:type IV secretory pathway TraG/TraD family ATPase VirD4
VLSSVKADLLATTQGWRSTLGDVRVYDPTSSTTPKGTSALWSPLQQAGNRRRRAAGSPGAVRCRAPRRRRGRHGLLAGPGRDPSVGLLFVAHHAHRDMDAVCEWVLTQDRPGELGPGEVRAALDC